MSSETALTGGQIRAARGFVRWSAETLAERSHVGLSTVKRAESTDGPPLITRANLDAIQRTLEAIGIDFFDDGAGPAVRKRAADR